MRRIAIPTIVLIISFTSIFAYAATSTENNPEILITNSESELYVSDAAFFPANSKQAVVFVPGFIFNKESWFKLAKSFQEKGIASLSISGKSVPNVQAAIKLLKEKGFQEICLIGGSSGAAAILSVLETEVKGVTTAITLSAVRGTPITDDKIKKLFVVSKEEKSFNTVQKLFADSAEPKSLKVFEGAKHAQFLFFSPNKEELTQIIIDFIK